jgi:hypothetical protein
VEQQTIDMDWVDPKTNLLRSTCVVLDGGVSRSEIAKFVSLANYSRYRTATARPPPPPHPPVFFFSPPPVFFSCAAPWASQSVSAIPVVDG